MNRVLFTLFSIVTLLISSCEGPQGDGGSPGPQGPRGDAANTLRYYLQRGGGSITYGDYSDTNLRQSAPANETYSTADTLTLSTTERAVIRFGDLLDALPANAQVRANSFSVNEAILYLYLDVPAAAEFSVYDMLAEEDVNISSATWANASTNTAWEEPGAGEAIDAASLIGYTRIGTSMAGVVAIYLNPEVVQSWMNNDAVNNGLLITSSADQAATLLSGDWDARPNLLHYRPLLYLDLQRTNTRVANTETYPNWQEADEKRAYQIWLNAPFNN